VNGLVRKAGKIPLNVRRSLEAWANQVIEALTKAGNSTKDIAGDKSAAGDPSAKSRNRLLKVMQALKEILLQR